MVTAILSGAGTRDFLYHTLLAHNLVKEYYHSIYPPFWSIAIEWQIYLIYPLLIIAASKVRQHIMLILLAGIGIASSLISSGFIASLIGTDVLGIIGRIPTAFLFSWMLGFYMAESVKHGRRLDCSPRLLVLSLTVGVLFESYPNTCFLNSVPWTLAAYQTAALFISNRHHRVFRMFDWLAWVGVISYSIYLSHDLFAFTYSYVANFLNLTKGSVISGVSAAFVMIIPILLLGYISFKLIEMPGIWIGKQLRSNLWNPKNQKP